MDTSSELENISCGDLFLSIPVELPSSFLCLPATCESPVCLRQTWTLGHVRPVEGILLLKAGRPFSYLLCILFGGGGQEGGGG